MFHTNEESQQRLSTYILKTLTLKGPQGLDYELKSQGIHSFKDSKGLYSKLQIT